MQTPRIRRTPTLIGLLTLLLGALLLAIGVSGQAAAHPVSSGANGDTITVHVKQATITEAGCEGGGTTHDGAHFILNQIAASDAPASITVFFSDGTSMSVPLDRVNGKAASYTAHFDPGKVITDATAVVPSDWSGQFVISNYLCQGASTSPPPSTTSTSQTATQTQTATETQTPTETHTATATATQTPTTQTPTTQTPTTGTSSSLGTAGVSASRSGSHPGGRPGRLASTGSSSGVVAGVGAALLLGGLLVLLAGTYRPRRAQHH